MLKNEYLVAKFGFDTAENEPSKIFGPACLPPPTNLITYGIIDGDSTRDEYMFIPLKLLWINQHPKGVRSGRRRIRRTSARTCSEHGWCEQGTVDGQERSLVARHGRWGQGNTVFLVSQ